MGGGSKISSNSSSSSSSSKSRSSSSNSSRSSSSSSSGSSSSRFGYSWSSRSAGNSETSGPVMASAFDTTCARQAHGAGLKILSLRGQKTRRDSRRGSRECMCGGVNRHEACKRSSSGGQGSLQGGTLSVAAVMLAAVLVAAAAATAALAVEGAVEGTAEAAGAMEDGNSTSQQPVNDAGFWDAQGATASGLPGLTLRQAVMVSRMKQMDESYSLPGARSRSVGGGGGGSYVLVRLAKQLVNSLGGYCLDGSRPGYYFRQGYSDGANNWIIYIQGGAWCFSPAECKRTSKGPLGSSNSWPLQRDWFGIMSSDPKVNPKLYNWNAVYLQYCDGGGFMGNRREPYQFNSSDGSSSHIFFRGKKILEAFLWELKQRRQVTRGAQRVLIGGESAGGLAALTFCDRISSMFGPSTVVKCMNDAGFFLDVPSVRGVNLMRQRFQSLLQLHEAGQSLPQPCLSSRSKDLAWQCIFPQHFAQFIRRPVFVISSFYDSFQLTNSLVPIGTLGVNERLQGTWKGCLPYGVGCSKSQWRIVKNFGTAMLQSVTSLAGKRGNGAFLFGCFLHTTADRDPNWLYWIRVHGMSMSKGFTDWLFSDPSGTSASHVLIGCRRCRPCSFAS